MGSPVGARASAENRELQQRATHANSRRLDDIAENGREVRVEELRDAAWCVDACA
jgi:hypothetical protein